MNTRRKPVADAGALHWRCPHCGTRNGLPERPTCQCGAVLQDGHAVKPADT